jgi:hypothetical protein
MAKIQSIIREARGDRNQAEFGKFIGKSQGLVSKYESGAVNPPADVLETCMDILVMNNGADVVTDISIDNLTKRVRAELKAPQFAYARRTIASLLDGLRADTKNYS